MCFRTLFLFKHRSNNVSGPALDLLSLQATIDEFEQKLRACHTRGLEGTEELEHSSHRATPAKAQSTGTEALSGAWRLQ